MQCSLLMVWVYQKENAMNFDATGDGVTYAYASMSKATTHYRASDETSYDIFEKSEDE